MSKIKASEAKKSSNTKINKENKNDNNIKFLIPIILGIFVLIAAVFAKNITVKRTMSITETKTIECTSENYDDRESDAVCGTGYSVSGNSCQREPQYTYTCPNGGNPNGTNCVYAAGVSVEPCYCSDTNPGTEHNGIAYCDSVNSTCQAACSAAGFAYAETPNRSCGVCSNGGNLWGSNCIYEATQTPNGYTYSGSITCTANTYTVRYNKNNSNATGTTADSIHIIGEEKTLTPNGYALGGHIFNGWNKKADGTGTNYTDKQSVLNLSTTNGDVVNLYAKWTPCPAGQYAEAGATECSPCLENTYTSEEGQSACLTCPEGKTVNSNHTACVDAVAGTYTVRYNKNNENATGTTADSIHTIGVAKTLTPNGYALGGHIFNGWNKKADGTGTNYADKQSVTNLSTTNGAVVDLYAKWTACPAGQYAEAGAAECSPCLGNTYTNDQGQSACLTCPEGQVANSTHTGCVVGTYEVEYKKNHENVTGTMANSIHTIGVAKTLTPNAYKLGGYIFGGWNSKADGTGTNYTDEQSVINLSTTNGAVVPIYAKWTACPAGQYAEAGATKCSPCVDETYTEEPGQAACLACPEGQVANSDHTGCEDGTPEKVSCQAGTYLKANGKTEEDCEVCPEGYYCPGGDYTPDDKDQGKEPCPEGHIDGGVGLSKEESCKIKCENGYYKDDTAATSCVACPDGTTSLAHYVNFSRVSDDGTCFTKEYKCYVCGASIKTYTWTNKYMGNDQSCVVDANKNSSDKCKEDIVNPKTGLFEVGGILIGLLGISAVGYYLLKNKKMISNI